MTGTILMKQDQPVTDTLKPCAHCGGEAYLAAMTDRAYRDGIQHVKCRGCAMYAPSVIVWNNRTGDQALRDTFQAGALAMREAAWRAARSYEEGLKPASGWSDEMKDGFETGVADCAGAIEDAIRRIDPASLVLSPQEPLERER